MHALFSAEVPVCGEPPHYEVPTDKIAADELRESAETYVLKLLWPQRFPEVIAGGGKTVWLYRQPRAQALSLAQCLYDMGFAPLAQREIAALERQVQHDGASALGALRDAGHAVLRLDFGQMTAEPVGTFRRVLEHFEIEHDDMRVFMGAAAIRRRSDEAESWNFYRRAPRFENSEVAREAVRSYAA